MRNNKPLLIVGVLVVVLLMVSLVSQRLNHPPLPEVKETEEERHEKEHGQIIGQPVPDFSLPTLDYKTGKLSDYKGKNSILLFFISAKQPTAPDYLDILEKMEKKYADQGLKSIAVFITSQRPEVTEFIKKHPTKVPVLLDPNTTIGMQYIQVASSNSFLIDKNGCLFSTFMKPEPKDLEVAVDEAISCMVEGKPAPDAHGHGSTPADDSHQHEGEADADHQNCDDETHDHGDVTL